MANIWGIAFSGLNLRVGALNGEAGSISGEIFISYASEDRQRIRPLADTLEARGWSVFWDREIPAGKSWREVLDHALKDARCVLVAWSENSIVSRWVQEEAEDGRDRAILIPVLIDNVRPPLGFRSVQAADLSAWDHTKPSEVFEGLLANIDALLRPSHPETSQADQGPRIAIQDGLEALPLPDKPSIVVLPFSNISGDPEQEYFADGITEDITTELSRYSELFVIACNTAFTYKGQPVNILDVARELGVHFVLEGSVRKAGNRVRINAQLIDGQNGNHLWAERFEGSIEEVFELQDTVTRQVVGATVPRINEAELSRIRRGDRIFDRAHDLAWRALDDFENGGRLAQPALMEDAKAKAYQAIEHNERCFLAYYVICMACWRELRLQWSDDPAGTLSELKRTAETYLSLAPQSHRAHLCSGLAKTNAGSTVAGVQDLRHSVELNPNDGMVQGLLAIVEVQLGNLKEGKEIAEKAIRINPKGRSSGAGYLALTQAAFVEDDKQFRDYAERAIKAQPNSPNRRALMIAYAAEIGDQTLLQIHLQHLNTIAPRFIPRLLSGEVDLFKIPQQREKFLSALRKAVPSE